MHTYTLTCASVFLVGLSECTCLCKLYIYPHSSWEHITAPSHIFFPLVWLSPLSQYLFTCPLIRLFIRSLGHSLGLLERSVGKILRLHTTQVQVWEYKASTAMRYTYSPSTGMRVQPLGYLWHQWVPMVTPGAPQSLLSPWCHRHEICGTTGSKYASQNVVYITPELSQYRYMRLWNLLLTLIGKTVTSTDD